MTTPPSGRLAWAQAGSYDAVDDRAVITALARGKVGTLATVQTAAGSGLQVIARGGWIGVAPAGDGTHCVVGAREDHAVDGSPGPATGTREDLMWCETDVDEGVFHLRILPAVQAAELPGIPLARILVPAGANLASQMTITGMEGRLERRLISWSGRNYTISNFGWDWTGWGNAMPSGLESDPCRMVQGNWYRVIHMLNSVDHIEQGLNGAIGVGWRIAGTAQNTAVLARADLVPFIAHRRAASPSVSWTFRYADAAPVDRIFEGRYWGNGYAVFRMGTVAGIGEHQILTVEDLGT